MTKRILRRKVIIREYDFNKVREQAFTPLIHLGLNDTLYDRAEFTPLNNDNLEKLKLVEVLKGKHNPLSGAVLNLEIPALTLYQLKDYLYNEKYCHWNVSIDEDGYLCVQARKNTPKSRIGWGVFEKDTVSRI